MLCIYKASFRGDDENVWNRIRSQIRNHIETTKRKSNNVHSEIKNWFILFFFVFSQKCWLYKFAIENIVFILQINFHILLMNLRETNIERSLESETHYKCYKIFFFLDWYIIFYTSIQIISILMLVFVSDWFCLDWSVFSWKDENIHFL